MERLEDALHDFSLAVALNPKNPVTKVQKCYTEYRAAINDKNEKKLVEVMKSFETFTTEHSSCPECFTLYAQVPTFFRCFLS